MCIQVGIRQGTWRLIFYFLGFKKKSLNGAISAIRLKIQRTSLRTSDVND